MLIKSALVLLLIAVLFVLASKLVLFLWSFGFFGQVFVVFIFLLLFIFGETVGKIIAEVFKEWIKSK